MFDYIKHINLRNRLYNYIIPFIKKTIAITIWSSWTYRILQQVISKLRGNKLQERDHERLYIRRKVCLDHNFLPTIYHIDESELRTKVHHLVCDPQLSLRRESVTN